MSTADEVLARLQSASSLTIVCHDDPDPDSLSSAIALELLANESGVDSVDILYDGAISHQQNRVFVDLFDVQPKRYTADIVEANELVAFVDHSLPGEHNPVPAETSIDIVIDHHPTDQPVPAAITDVRVGYGATATILTEYVRETHVEITPRIAAALLFGIHRERLDFYRQPTDREYDAASYLHSRADPALLRDLYGASFMPTSVDALGDIIHNRVRHGSCLVSCIGRLTDTVALAQAADFLLTIDGIDTVLVCGITRDELHLSGRTTRTDLDLGDSFERLFDEHGSVGGHSDMAGGQIPLDSFVDTNGTEAELVERIRRRLETRFFETVPDGVVESDV